jgi:hypothetical protein
MDSELFPVILTAGILIFTLGIMALSFGGVFLFYYKKRKRMQHLAENGVRGKALIKTLSDTGMIINNVPQIAMTLEVTLPNVPVYTIQKRVAIPMIYYPRIQPGMTVDVAVDPTRLTDQKYIGLMFE